MDSPPAGQVSARLRPVSLPLLVALAVVTGCGDTATAPMDESPPPPSDEPPAALGWQTLSGSPDAEEGRFEDVFFLTPDLGWIVSLRGEVYGTEDGGTNWTLLFQAPGIPFRAVGFATSDLGWAGNINGLESPAPDTALYETRDGGSTWSNITGRVSGPEPVGICGIWVQDEETVYAAGRWAGPPIFLRTEDGGQSWTSTDLSPLLTGAVDLHFFDADTGLVVGGRGVGPGPEEQRSSRTVILRTTDGGRTWEERYVGSARGEWAWKISFPGPDVGYVSTQGPANSGTVLKTEDGGRTWRALTVADSAAFSGIGFSSETLGWVAGSAVYQTEDGGETWQEVTLGQSINRFRFLGPDLGFASGRRVYVFR